MIWWPICRFRLPCVVSVPSSCQSNGHLPLEHAWNSFLCLLVYVLYTRRRIYSYSPLFLAHENSINKDICLMSLIGCRNFTFYICYYLLSSLVNYNKTSLTVNTQTFRLLIFIWSWYTFHSLLKPRHAPDHGVCTLSSRYGEVASSVGAYEWLLWERS